MEPGKAPLDVASGAAETWPDLSAIVSGPSAAAQSAAVDVQAAALEEMTPAAAPVAPAAADALGIAHVGCTEEAALLEALEAEVEAQHLRFIEEGLFG